MTKVLSVEAFPSASLPGRLDVAWRAGSDDVPAEDMLFMVQWSERDSGPWNDAFDAPLEGAVSASGVGPGRRSSWPSLFVRVSALDPSGSVLASSAPASPGPAMDRKAFLEYRDSLRREGLALSKLAGTRTMVHQRPALSCPCPECSDPILGGNMDSHCPRCAGTGIDGGYFPPVEILADWSGEPEGSGTRTQGQAGPEESEARSVRMLPFPSVSSRDVLTIPGTSSVWEVEECRTVDWRVWPVARRARIRMLAKGDPANSVLERGVPA